MGHRDRGDIDRIRKISISPISPFLITSVKSNGNKGTNESKA